MNTILSVVKNGRIELEVPADWSEGSIVRVALGVNGTVTLDDERPETPEEIEAWIHRFRAIEPIVMTPEEEAAWEADRKAQKEFEIANAAERVASGVSHDPGVSFSSSPDPHRGVDTPGR